MELNPYQSPATTATLAPPAGRDSARPTILTVIGILNLIFGALGIVGLIGTWLLLSMSQGLFPAGPNPVLDAMKTNATYRTFTQASLVLGGFATVALIASGVGLLQMRPYGRTLAIGYGIYALIAAVAGMIVNFALVFGPMLESMQRLPPAQRAGVIGGMIGGVVGGGVGMVYPAILLYCMYRPNVLNALRRP